MFISVLCSAAKRGISKNSFSVPCSKLTTSRCTISFVKLLSTKPRLPSKLVTKGNLKPIGPKDNFVSIYRLPEIRYVALVNRMKKKQFIIQSIITPVILALWYSGVTTPELSFYVLAVGLTLCIKLYILGLFTKNFVGAIYVSPDMSTIQISYINQWGQRAEDVFPSDDIVPLSELPTSRLEKWYRQLRRYSSPSAQLYKLSLSKGDITDIDRFTNIFGKVD